MARGLRQIKEHDLVCGRWGRRRSGLGGSFMSAVVAFINRRKASLQHAASSLAEMARNVATKHAFFHRMSRLA